MRARKRFGQHFLEPAWVDQVIAAIDAAPDDTFLEIGPGRGALTRPLAARAGRLLAVEIDRDLAAALAAARACRTSRSSRATSSTSISTRRSAWLAPRRPDAGPRRRQPALQHRVADPVPAARLRPATAGVQRRDADAAEGGRRPAGRAGPARGDYGVADDAHGAAAPTSTRLLDAAAGRVPAAAARSPRRWSGCASGRRRSTIGDPADVRPAWSGASSRSAGRRWPTR